MSDDKIRGCRTGRLQVFVLLTAVVLGLAGCSGSTDGTPTAAGNATSDPANGAASGTGSAGSSTAKADEVDLWDPCALPDSALSATGMESASKESGIAGVDFTAADWKVCKWMASADWYWLTIFSGTPTLAEVEARDDFVELTPTTVGSHKAVQYRMAGAGYDLSCDIAVELDQGIVMLKVGARASMGAQEDPCGVVNRHAADLASYLPAK